jgi:hypothetical protein
VRGYFTHSMRLATLAAFFTLSIPARLAAQHLEPASDAEHCHGERIVAISHHGIRRNFDGMLGQLGATATDVMRYTQPLTPSHVVIRYLLLRVGDVCDEQRRQASETILRSEPFISDAVIRVHPTGGGNATLQVETIDEYVVHVEGWGLTGVPAGFDIGTSNLFNGARSLSVLAEYGRGGDIGSGFKFEDHQAFNAPLDLTLQEAIRPLGKNWSASLSQPYLSDYQPSSWQVDGGYENGYIGYHSPSFGEEYINYERRSWGFGGVTRVSWLPRSIQLGAFLDGEEANALRTTTLGVDGVVTTPDPFLLQQFQDFEAVRLGVAAGYRSIHPRPVRGIDALSAPQDIPFGGYLFVVGLQSLPVVEHDTPDWIVQTSAGGAIGSDWSILQAAGGTETRLPRTGDLLPQSTAEGRIAWTGKTSLEHKTSVSLEFAGGWRTRIPTQVTFRDDDGLLGYRSSDLGGGERTIVRLEDRYMIPSPSSHVELALAGLFESGRLVAAGAPYGITTPWLYSAGAALIVAVPSGSKQTLRIEWGKALNPYGATVGEWRIVYADRTRSFLNPPSSLWLGREDSAVGVP